MAAECPTPWLGSGRGYFTDWLTQVWVKITGRIIDRGEHAWLDGPAGGTREIGEEFFERFAGEDELTIERQVSGAGLIADFARALDIAPAAAIADFYQRTSCYDLDVWSEWAATFRPFGWLLSYLFSRRLRQLNMPLSSLDTRFGVTSEIVRFRSRRSDDIRATAWLRCYRATGAVIYSGLYSTCTPPGYQRPCVKVVFPLPNGSATVVLRPEVDASGQLALHSGGRQFGDPGFYFVVRKDKIRAWARYVKSMREKITVYVDGSGTLRTDHLLTIWRMPFLRLHYRMTPREARAQSPAS